jgi:hypothetical protein
MRLLGEIVRLQVQTASLKIGQPPRRRYDPAGIHPVASLSLTPDGVRGWTEDGQSLEDVHNLTHPESKNRGGTNGISVGFDAHYDAMRARFGQHIADGIAGENILVALADKQALYGEHDFLGGITIEAANGQTIRLAQVIVAAPCAEFTRYALRFPDDARPDRTVTEALRFLDDGMRGFYAAYNGPETHISLDDRVWLP